MEKWFLALNPAHKVPLLQNDDFLLAESHAIMKYIVQKFANNKNLYPQNLETRAKIDECLLAMKRNRIQILFSNILEKKVWL